MDYTDNPEKKINTDDSYEEAITPNTLKICQEPFNVLDNMRTGIRGSNAEYNSFCPFCEFKTSEFDRLKSHINTTHTIVKFKQCPYCQLKNLSQVNLNQHIRAYHWDKLIHKCNECDYRAAKVSNLNAHKRSIHLNDKRQECGTCGYRTALSSRLKFHLATVHNTEKLYRCPFCNYRTAVSSTLKTHIMAKHEKKKPHQCPKCIYKATQIGTLNKHIARHFQSKPYRFKHSSIKERNGTKTESCTSEGNHVSFKEVSTPLIDTLQPKNQQNLKCCADQTPDVKSLLSNFLKFHRENTASKCHFCCYSAINDNSLNIHLMTHHTKQYLDTFSKRHEQTLQMCRLKQ